jgi:GNAT superfamily N-acetyltransferase
MIVGMVDTSTLEGVLRLSQRPNRQPRPTPRFVEPTPSPVDFLAGNYLRAAPQIAKSAAATNIFNPVPLATEAVNEGRLPTGAEAGLDAGFLAAGFLPVGKALQGLKFINRGSRNVAEPDVRYVEAVLPEAQRVNPEDAVGHMRILPDGTVGQVFVEPDFRRQGIATEMWNYANREGLNPVHSPVADQTAAGKAWIASLGTPRPGLTVTGTGDAGRLSALVRRLNKSNDVGDFMTPQTMRNAARPNDANEGLFRPGAQSFDYKSVPEPASPYTFGLVPTEKLSPLREFDRAAEPVGRKYTGPDNIKKLAEHMAEGGKWSDPTGVAYYPDQQWGYLAEGNHRLALAEALGLEQIPTTVWRQQGLPLKLLFAKNADGQAVGRRIGPLDTNQLKRDPFGDFPESVGDFYVPPTMNPYLLKYFQQ